MANGVTDFKLITLQRLRKVRNGVKVKTVLQDRAKYVKSLSSFDTK